MEWTWLERVTSKRKRVMEELVQGRVMEELVQGRAMANQLREVIGSDISSAESLVTKILGSLSNTLVILNEECYDNEQEVISHVEAESNNTSIVTTASGSSSWDDVRDHGVMKSEDSNGEICKSAETFKDRRGSYKRRKTSHSWTKDTSELVDDGYQWRKYGQKMILKSKHPRNYFRCTHKFDQGCKATKHVQTMEGESQLIFRTTYIGNHICTNHLRAPELVLDCSSQEDSSRNMIRFDISVNALSCKQEHPFFTSIKKESVKKEEVVINIPSRDLDHMNHYNHSSILSSDCFVSPIFETSGDQSDVISRIMARYFLDNEVDYP